MGMFYELLLFRLLPPDKNWGEMIEFICWWSKKFPRLLDLHDYHTFRGGDGIPTHWYTYRCWNCNHEFQI